MVEKRFPSDIRMVEKTFLNDKKINGELYAFLQAISYYIDGETRVYKKMFPTIPEICALIGVKSPKTYRTRMKYLLDTGFLQDKGEYYTLLNKEDTYLLIPLETIKYMEDVFQDLVIKVYVYLGVKDRLRESGEEPLFTVQELATHLGYNVLHKSNIYEKFNNILDVLRAKGLIDYRNVYVNDKPYKQLTKFSLLPRKILD